MKIDEIGLYQYQHKHGQDDEFGEVRMSPIDAHSGTLRCDKPTHSSGPESGLGFFPLRPQNTNFMKPPRQI